MSSALHPSCLALVAEYLTFGEIKVARLVCKGWYDSVTTAWFYKSAVIKITGSLNEWQATNETLQQQYQYLCSSDLLHRVHFVCFQNATLHVNKFWAKYGPHIESLKFYNVMFEIDSELEGVLSSCPNLKWLALHNCMSKSADPPIKPGTFTLPNLQVLRFRLCNLSSYLYHNLQISTGPIKELVFDDCYVRINSVIGEPGIAVMHGYTTGTYEGIDIDKVHAFIAHHIDSLQSLCLANLPGLNESDLINLLKSDQLTLLKFNLKDFPIQIGTAALTCLKQSQASLKEIVIENISLDGHLVKDIGNCFPALKVLCIGLRRSDLHFILNSISEFKELDHLNIGLSVFNIGQVNIDAITTLEYWSKFKVLKLDNFSPMYIPGSLFSQGVPLSITILKLSGVNNNNMVDDVVVQNICKWMRELTDLDLSLSNKVTDYGLAGYKNGVVQPGSFSLCSSLSKLKRLNLAQCVRITDLSLLHAIIFRDLISLDISHCHPITDKGISVLGKQNPSLEDLKLESVSLISDKGLGKMLEHTPRLRRLSLKWCPGLSFASIRSITKYCPSMRWVEMRHQEWLKSAFDYLYETLPMCALSGRDPFSKVGEFAYLYGPFSKQAQRVFVSDEEEVDSDTSDEDDLE